MALMSACAETAAAVHTYQLQSVSAAHKAEQIKHLPTHTVHVTMRLSFLLRELVMDHSQRPIVFGCGPLFLSSGWEVIFAAHFIKQ